MIFLALKGFLLSASLIVAIGLQNAFILRQGLKNRFVFISALTAALIDSTLITLGIFGFGRIIEAFPNLNIYVGWLGAVFLILYGLKSIINAFQTQGLDETQAKNMLREGGIKETILILLAVSLLNPHVYLDTFVVIGSIGASYVGLERIVFGLGAVIASFIWFFGLAYGAQLLRPVFEKPKAWFVLDIIIGIVMFLIAGSLVFKAL